MLPILLAALVSALATSAAHARQGTVPFDLITAVDGIPDNYILSLLQDRSGFLWLGTRNGIAVHDGRAFTVYKHDISDDKSISDGGVDCLLEDDRGGIWIGTSGGGLDRFDRVTGRFVHYRYDARDPHTIGGNRILALTADRRGNIWIATPRGGGGGLSRLDLRTGMIHRYRHDPASRYGLSSDGVTSVVVDPRGTVWVGTDNRGICRYDADRDRFVGADVEPSYLASGVDAVTILHADELGRLWCRRNGGGLLMVIPGARGVTVDTAHPLNAAGLRSSYVITIHKARSGLLWIGTGFDGAFVVDERTGRLGHFSNNPVISASLASNRVFSIVEDRSGNVWLGTDNGVNKLNRMSRCFTYYPYDPRDSGSLGFMRVRSILRDGTGTLWVGTGGGGLDALAPGGTTFRHHHFAIPRRPFVSSNTINALYEDRSGGIWAGTNSGLFHFDPGMKRVRYYEHKVADPTSINLGGVWDILEDREGMIWCGTLSTGLNRLDVRTGRFTRIARRPGVANGLSDNNVHCLHQDRRGLLWIGSDGGLDVYDPRTGRWRNYHHDPTRPTSLSNDRVWHILESRSGAFWIATSGGGLNRFDPATGIFTHYLEKDGLANDMVCAVTEDDAGLLWISTSNGLSRLDPATGRFKTFAREDGVPVSEFHFKASFNDRGRLLFGGSNGVIEFDPDSIRDNRLIPPVAITSFKLFGREVRFDTLLASKREIRLDHRDSYITIEFAALDFTNPVANRYLYRLEGFDADWRLADGTRAFASYTNLPPGNYSFRVKAANSDGAWNVTGATLDIVIEPAFWQTLWFRLAAAAVALCLLGGAVALRIRSVRRKAELERQVVESQLRALQAQMNPHFIFNSLNSILNFIATHDSASAHKYLLKFSKLMRLILESSRSDSISLAEEVAALELYLELESLRFDGRFEFLIDVDQAIDPYSIEIPPMLIQPYVENAVKHGLASVESGGRITIRFRPGGEKVICVIEDNGIGRERAEALKGKFASSIRSAGMGVTSDRLGILNDLSGHEFSVDVSDLVAPDRAPAGTRVELHISHL